MARASVREFATKVAELINGEVVEIEKANGVIKIGVQRRQSKTTPILYVEDAFKRGISAEEVAESYERNVNEAPNLSLDFSNDYNTARSMLKARLYNKSTKADIYVSAEPYGFDDLIIVPYIELGENGDRVMSVKVTNGLKTVWGVEEKTVIMDAIQNTMEQGFNCKSMAEIMAEMMGVEQAEMMGIVDDGKMYVLTNEDKTFGAIGACLEKEMLEEKFPNGYYVIPSSVHEVIIVPKTVADMEELNGMVNDVNDECLDPEEVLGNKVYEF